jgi:hypothetical protein
MFSWDEVLAMNGEANSDVEEMDIFTVTFRKGQGAIVFECEDQNQLVLELLPLQKQAMAAALTKEAQVTEHEREAKIIAENERAQIAEEVEARKIKEEEETKKGREEEEAARQEQENVKKAKEEAKKAKTKSKRQAMLEKKKKQKAPLQPRVSQADITLMDKIMDYDTGFGDRRTDLNGEHTFIDPIAAAHERKEANLPPSERMKIQRKSSNAALLLANSIIDKQMAINEKRKAKEEDQKAIRAIEEAEKCEKLAKERIEAERAAYEAMTQEERDAASVRLLMDMEADAAAESKRLVEELTRGEDDSLRLARQLGAGGSMPVESAASGNDGEEEHGPMDDEDRARQRELAAMSDPSRFPTRIWTAAAASDGPECAKTKRIDKLEGLSPHFKKILKVLINVHGMLAATWDETHPDYEKYDFEEDEVEIGDFIYRNKEPTSHLRASRKKLRKLLKEHQPHGSLLHKGKKILKHKKKRKDGKGGETDQLDESQKKCNICESFFDKGDEVRTLPCLHTFHSKSCIDKWLRTSDKCPVCQSQVQFLGLRLDVENSWDFAEHLADNGQLV